jgi:hypothetical protein
VLACNQRFRIQLIIVARLCSCVSGQLSTLADLNVAAVSVPCLQGGWVAWPVRNAERDLPDVYAAIVTITTRGSCLDLPPSRDVP